jgi:hypothetical protein
MAKWDMDEPDLLDPTVVHANMLLGKIAKPTLNQLLHLYGPDEFSKLLAVKPIDISETWVVVHAAGSLEFFYDVSAAADRAEWLGRGYYEFNDEFIKSYGRDVEKLHSEWIAETQEDHRRYILNQVEFKYTS